MLHCQYRDRDAWEELIGLYDKRLFYYIKQIVSDEDEALNLLQDTWVRVVKFINQIREPAYVTSWLYRIARNVALGYLRKKKVTFDIDDCGEEIFSDQEEESDDFAVEKVNKGMKKLSMAHREVLTLFFLEDMSLKEVSEILDIPVGTVRSRLHYAKRSLKDALGKEQ